MPLILYEPVVHPKDMDKGALMELLVQAHYCLKYYQQNDAVFCLIIYAVI